MSNQALKIFISYGRKDARGLAVRLRDDIMRVGYSVWLDMEEIPGGVDWAERIEQAIEEADVVLALMSHAAYASKWCRAEQLRAIRKGKRIIPLLVQPDAERPLHLEHLNFFNFCENVNYDDALRDLLSDITAGRAFRRPTPTAQSAPQKSIFKAPKGRPKAMGDEKRTAGAFRSFLAELRREAWLGSRYWWPYFLFHFTTVENVVQTLSADELVSPVMNGENLRTRWDKFVRLDFRPRTPSLYRVEGFRPIEQQREGYTPMPIYLLFDLEAVITLPEASFCAGDPQRLKKTYKTPTFFREMPFEQIYHDSWFMPDERDEIMTMRSAQVLVPERLGLESLQYIWCRSTAEYETLRNLLPKDIWQRWRDKITPRTDFNLFNRRWLYVEEASLEANEAVLQFHPCETACSPYEAQIKIIAEDGGTYAWKEADFAAEGRLVISIPEGCGAYRLELRLDGDLAYVGKYTPRQQVL